MVDAAIIVVVIVISIVVSALVAFRSRNKFLESKRRFDWVPPSCVVVGACIVFVSLMVYSAYAEFLYFLFFAPIIFLTCLVLLVAAAIRYIANGGRSDAGWLRVPESVASRTPGTTAGGHLETMTCDCCFRGVFGTADMTRSVRFS